MPNTASVSDLQRNYAQLLRKVHETKEPLILLKDNHAEAALLDINKLEELYMIKRGHEEKEIKKAIASYEKAKKAGKLMSATSVDELFKMVEDEDRKILPRTKISKVSSKTLAQRAKRS